MLLWLYRVPNLTWPSRRHHRLQWPRGKLGKSTPLECRNRSHGQKVCPHSPSAISWEILWYFPSHAFYWLLQLNFCQSWEQPRSLWPPRSSIFRCWAFSGSCREIIRICHPRRLQRNQRSLFPIRRRIWQSQYLFLSSLAATCLQFLEIWLRPWAHMLRSCYRSCKILMW